MALQITHTRDMFSVFGKLNSTNINILSRHMRRFIHPDRRVILNLERVQAMDSAAAYAIQQLYLSAMRENSILSIVGLYNDNILPVFRSTKTAYILSDDRI